MRLNKGLSLDRLRLKRLNKILKQVNSYASQFSDMTDEDLKAQTSRFKARLQRGETLNQLLPEAYATVREVAKRVLGMFPYDVQVLGAIVLHQGNIAEMRTGEGKTLTATMPLYLNALSEKGVMLVTVNDYLARRDMEGMGEIYRFLGLSVGFPISTDDQDLSAQEKRSIYASDIIYTTHSALGFDYLIDNLASRASDKFLPDFHYAIVDEADAVLLDGALTPLIISGQPRVQSNLYRVADDFVTTLVDGKDYYHNREEKEVWLKQSGIDEAEKMFTLPNLYDQSQSELVRHINLALKARTLYHRDKDYVIQDDEVKLLDIANGRVLEGTRIQGGQHQAIEEKEKVEITPEMRSMASITYQNLFLMFDVLAGMTGTAKSIEEEMIATYNMEVVSIPTHKPIKRKDLPDIIYATLPEKLRASVRMIKDIHATGQPLLIVAGTVRLSELYSELLLLEGIPHNLLNAQNVAREAQMIAEAGQFGAVTVATNMAGRGTDIKLSDQAKSVGGLAVIGTERMENERMDLQVRGRSGRQGDPGFSQFFISLEDDLLVTHGGERVLRYLRKVRDKSRSETPIPLSERWLSKAIQHAQDVSEASARSARDLSLAFDESVKVQRDYVYQQRNDLINQKQTFDLQLLIEKALKQFLTQADDLDAFQLERFILDNISYDFRQDATFPRQFDKATIFSYLKGLIKRELISKQELLKDDFQLFQQMAVLKAIDTAWIEEVDYLQQLRILVTGRMSAQRNPIHEYHKEAKLAYDIMIQDIYRLSLKHLLLSQVSYSDWGELRIQFH